LPAQPAGGQNAGLPQTAPYPRSVLALGGLSPRQPYGGIVPAQPIGGNPNPRPRRFALRPPVGVLPSAGDKVA